MRLKAVKKWVGHYWRTILGVFSLVPVGCRAVVWMLSQLGNIDFVITHINEPGWVGRVIELIINPPGWLLTAALLGGLGLLFWDNRRHRQFVIETGHPAEQMDRSVGLELTSPAAAPKIEICFEKGAPYEVNEVSNGNLKSTVRVGLKNSGGGPLSNCKVYIEKVVPEVPLSGGLPILLEGAGFVLRHDEPEKFVDIAIRWSPWREVQV
jgi:hypothetical protein